jgi:signal transduction histidine kinase
MDEEKLLKVLQTVDLFERFRPETLRDLVRTCPTVTLAPDQVLFAHGSPGTTMYVILEGYIQVFRNQRIIATVGPNECIGEMALVEAAPRSASARAIGPAKLLELSGDIFDRHLRTEPEALAVMMRTISKRLRKTIDETQTAYEEVNMLVHDMLNVATIFQAAEIVMAALPRQDENYDFLESILRGQQSLETMMRAALQRARGLSMPYQKEPVDLEALVRECLARDLAMHDQVQRASITVRAERPLAPVTVNRIDLKRVIVNLVINAAQALGDGGSIDLALRQADGRSLISVRDTGCGIPRDLWPHVFDAHFTTKPHGNGLGLSSCRDIVERLHQGRLTFTSVEGQGTTFVCELPG